ncbi:Hsp70 family protein [Plantactinospora sp. GCM10030261]|uniref:Hsp70 family protein n=1 Tax=Plantactinospora sp. GCM10030261 TaxID=3273420 RepID=UPI00360C10B6
MADQHDGFALSVDLGTSNTVAVLRRPDGRTRPLLIDGQPILPSGVYADQDGLLHVGRDAQRLAQADPIRFEPNPKRRVDEPGVLLGDREYDPAELFAAILRTIADAAVSAVGFLPPAVITCPATWDERRRRVLADALVRAGWPPAAEHTMSGPIPIGTRLLREPVAAARYYTEVLLRPVPVGAAIAVFDFGGGTLDIAVVRNEGADPWGDSGFTVAAAGGVGDLGGLDLDAALVLLVGQRIADGNPAVWQRLTAPETTSGWRDRHQFWENIRGAKEMLSRGTVAPVAVPGLEETVRLTREDLERLAAPLLSRAVAETREVVAAAGLTPDQLAGLFLVGGSSRVPLVARMLHAELGVAPTVGEQPELPVAEGALTDLPTRRPVPVPAGPPTPPAAPAQAGRPAAPAGPPIPPAAPAHAGLPTPPAHAEPPTPPDVLASPPAARNGVPTPRTGPAAPPLDGPTPVQPFSGPPASPTPGGFPGAPARSGVFHRRALWITLGAVAALAGVATAAVLYLTRDRHPELDYQSLNEVERIPAADERPRDMFTAVLGDRAYLAYSIDDDRLAVVAVDARTGAETWRRETRTEADDWGRIVALPSAVAVLGAETGDDPRPLEVLDATTGGTRWDRTIHGDDELLFGAEVAVLLDRHEDQLIGLDLKGGDPRWTHDNPRDTYDGAATSVHLVGTDEAAGGSAFPDGTPRAPWLGDGGQLVQVGADRSVRLIDMSSGRILRSRTDVADHDDLVAAHGDRLYVANRDGGYRLLAYDLTSLGEPTALYVAEGDQRRPEALVACGEHRACVLETNNFEAASARVVAGAEGEGAVSWPAPNARTLVPLGTRLLAGRPSPQPSTTLFDESGAVLRADRQGVAVKLDNGNLLAFAQPPSTSEGDHSVAWLGGHTGKPRELGLLADVRTASCSWSAEALVCGSGKDFVLYRFAES